MCCNDIYRLIISWSLNRGEAVNLFIVRSNYNSTRMLTSCSLNIYASLGESLHLLPSLFKTSIFTIISCISESCFISHGTYCTRLKGMVFSKYLTDICMCLCLVFTREIKVDIRLLITLESKERFEWNIMAFFLHLSATLWTIGIWHVTSTFTGICLYSV